MKKLIKYLYYSAALALLLTVSSAAYIDPSAMTYIIQIIAGVAIAAGAAFGFYWRRIKRFFTKNKDNAYVVDDDDDDDDDYGMDDYSLPDSAGAASSGIARCLCIARRLCSRSCIEHHCDSRICRARAPYGIRLCR